MWLASTSTSAAWRSALCASLNPRCASTMARNASSGLAKFELVDSAISKTSIDTRGTRQRRIQRRPCRVTEARGDIAVGPQQIGRAGLAIVARARQSRRINQDVTPTDTDRAYALRRVHGRAIAKRQQRAL